MLKTGYEDFRCDWQADIDLYNVPISEVMTTPCVVSERNFKSAYIYKRTTRTLIFV